MYNNIWLNNVYPTKWQEAIIIPILKPSKNQTEASNYRPLGLTNNISKIIEKMINCRLMRYLESQQFSQMHSSSSEQGDPQQTKYQHFNLKSRAHLNTGNIQQIFSSTQKKCTRALKYYIQSTLKAYNIQENVFKFCTNFLSNRKFKVKYNGHTSNIYTEQNERPQGVTLDQIRFI